MGSIRQTLASNIRNARKALGLTQDELAERSGVNRHVIKRLEAQSQFVTDKTAEALAHALNIEGIELFHEDLADRTVFQTRTDPKDIKDAFLWASKVPIDILKDLGRLDADGFNVMRVALKGILRGKGGPRGPLRGKASRSVQK